MLLVNILNLQFTGDHLFSVGNALVFLLLQPDMLPLPQQRVVATAILYFLYKNEPIKRNPFANVFLHIMVSPFLN